MSQVITFTDYVPATRFDGVAWTEVKVDEGTTSLGPWTTLDTITLSPVDSDPTNPQARNITITNASDTADLWYRLTFIDGNGDTGQPSTPIQNTSAVRQFVSASDFATRLGLTFTDGETDRANALLATASGMIQQRMRQKIALVTDDTYSVRSSYNDRVRLPERPVVDVTSVTLTLIGGNATYQPPANTWYLDRDEIVRTAWPLAAQYAFAGYQRGWLGPLYQMDVVYTHGFDPIPELVQSICMEMVTRVWVNPGSVARETIGDTQTVYDNMRFSPAGMQMTDTEYAQLRDLLRRHSNSIPLR